MNKQELIKKYKRLEGVWDAEGAEIARRIFLLDLYQLDEPEIVKVPKYIADKIEYMKKYDYNIFDAMRATERDDNFYDWLFADDNMEIFTIAWQYGCEVEEEKRYKVILCNGQSLKTVYRQGEDRLDFEKEYGDLERFTRKQLEEAGFGWVFDCPGIEVREVE